MQQTVAKGPSTGQDPTLHHATPASLGIQSSLDASGWPISWPTPAQRTPDWGLQGIGAAAPLVKRAHILSRGMCLEGSSKAGMGLSGGQANGGKRGSINEFSKASRRRLRESCIRLLPPDGWKTYSATWTVPGDPMTPDEWRHLWHTQSVRLGRLGVACIWRVELQRRGQPHVHAVVHMPGAAEVFGVVFEPWWDLLKSLGRFTAGAMAHSVHAKLFPDGDEGLTWYRYLVGHTVKHKAEQLGWQGRQWGILGKKWLKWDEGEDARLSTDQYYAVRRVVRRMKRMRRGLRSEWGKAHVMMSPAVARRIVEWAIESRPARRVRNESGGRVWTWIEDAVASLPCL